MVWCLPRVARSLSLCLCLFLSNVVVSMPATSLQEESRWPPVFRSRQTRSCWVGYAAGGYQPEVSVWGWSSGVARLGASERNPVWVLVFPEWWDGDCPLSRPRRPPLARSVNYYCGKKHRSDRRISSFHSQSSLAGSP